MTQISAAQPTRTANELARGLDAGEFSSEQLVTESLENIQTCDDQSIFIQVTSQRALEEATASDKRRRTGQLLSCWDGIPIAWKDLFDFKGLPTTAGTAVYHDAPPAIQDAGVVDACASLGLISLGKTNLSEFAYSGLGLNPHYGTPVNPHGTGSAYAPGGSSSGSAVAVARGLTPLAIGTDTAGSVRVPASFCGIAGFKSSQNRYFQAGVFPLSSSLDSLGSFARTVEELIQVDAMMRGQATAFIPITDLRDITFLVPETVVFDDINSEIKRAFERMTDTLSDGGATIQRQPFPIFSEVTQLFQQHGTLTVAEAYTLHEKLLNSTQADAMDQRVRTRMLTANQFSTSDYIHLQSARKRLQTSTTKALGSRFLLFPTTPITAPRIAELESSDTLFATTNLMALRNTMLGNYLGTPGLSLPIGSNSANLPIGALISAPFGQDDRLLSAARAVEMQLASSMDL